jgi:fructoselysine-6-P-deglycase FrlB-like protein
MKDFPINLKDILDQARAADVALLRRFLTSDPGQPLLATGSGGAQTVADFAALLYGARGGVATAVSPYTLNSYGDEALKTSKLLLVSKGGHNDDIVFAARRGLAVNPGATASFTLYRGERNEVRKLFSKAGSLLSFDIPCLRVHDGFVSTGTPVMYFALLCRAFDPGCDLSRYTKLPDKPFRLERNDGTELTPEDFRGVQHYVILHGSWGRPVASNLEGKLVESGLCTTGVYDYRNYCHGRFIFTSNHLEDSAVVLLVSSRERDIAERTRKFLPASAKLVVIETDADAPEASLDLLIRSSAFFFGLCGVTGTDWESPRNPGKIDKRRPMWVPFMAEMKRNGPLDWTERT